MQCSASVGATTAATHIAISPFAWTCSSSDSILTEEKSWFEYVECTQVFGNELYWATISEINQIHLPNSHLSQSWIFPWYKGPAMSPPPLASELILGKAPTRHHIFHSSHSSTSGSLTNWDLCLFEIRPSTVVFDLSMTARRWFLEGISVMKMSPLNWAPA